jgi:putative protease
VTLNTILYDNEIEAAWEQMLAVQDAGADALIVQDMATVALASERGYRLPLHASTQCAIRTPEQAAFLESLGFSRLILERELSLEQIRAIRDAVTCELEFFVHGALCVCYSGQCYLSEMIAGRSANRGACIQACRSRYDLVDEDGKVLVKDKALLSLKDYNLRRRLRELAEAGITSFKIEGRLKNESYVRNVVRDYSLELDRIVESCDSFERGSWGAVIGGFTPDTTKTFNRGYTELFIDGHKGRWAAMDAAKGMGEEIGEVTALSRDKSSITLRLLKDGVSLNNGDGFSFVARSGEVCGFRGDVCSGNTIRCKGISELFVGARIFRNIDIAFEKDIEKNPCKREIPVTVILDCRKGGACLPEG